MFTKTLFKGVAIGLVFCVASVAQADKIFMSAQLSDLCASNVGEWNECAPVTITVPPGKTAEVEIESSATLYESNVSQSVLVCIGVYDMGSLTRPTCMRRAAAGVDLDVSAGSVNDDLESVSTSLVVELEAGTYRLSTLIAPQDDRLNVEPLQDVGVVRTKVRVLEDPIIILPAESGQPGSDSTAGQGQGAEAAVSGSTVDQVTR